MRKAISYGLILLVTLGCKRQGKDDPRNQTNPAFVPPDQINSPFEPSPAEDGVEQWAKSIRGYAERDRNRPGWPVVALHVPGGDHDTLTNGLKRLATPANLRRLESTIISNEAMPSLAPLIGLISLNLNYSKITDAGFEPLRSLVSLRQINLSHTFAFQGIGLRHLPGLEIIDLSESAANDAGMAGLAGMKNLKELNLRKTSVGDAGVKHFGKLSTLETLDLSVTGVTDAGLDHLVNLPKLRILDLSATAVTDAGIRKLTHCPSLERVLIRETNVTADGAQVLKPRCEVIR